MSTKRTLRTTSALAAAAALTLTMTACNRGDSSTSNASGSSAAAGGDASGKSVTLALSTLNNPFFISVRDGAQEAAKAAGITLNVVDAQNDPATQANQLADAATKNQAAVIINPVDSDAAAAAVKPLTTAKIPVIAVDRAITGVTPTSFIASDNVAGGKQAAEALAKALSEKGEVIHLQGVAGTSASRDRGKGFTEGMKSFSNIKLVATQPADFDRTKGLNVTTNLMQSHSGVTGIFAENDEMALGAVQALGAKAGQQVKIFGFDGTDDGLKAVKDGKLVGTIAQQPAELGKAAVEQAAKAISGGEVSATVPIEVKTVTADNVAEYLK